MTTPITHSALYFGWLAHTRFRPVRHAFRHRVAFLLIDLDEIDAADHRLRLFSRNRFNLYGVRDRDYLGATDRDIKANLVEYVGAHGIDLSGGRILLMTNLRTLGYVFNPVSFFHCYDGSGTFRCAVAEVTNTFGERRAYLLDGADALAAPGGLRRWDTPKQMHVSPFFGLDQQYRFMLGETGDRLIAKVDLHDDDGRILTATQYGERRTLSDRALVDLTLRNPFAAQQVIGLIHLEALRLWRKGVPFHRKPRFRIPHGSLRAAPQPSELLGRREVHPPPPAPGPLTPRWPVAALTRWALRRPAGGSLRIRRKDLTVDHLPGPGPRDAEIAIHADDLYRRLLRRRRVAIGESYVAGDWDAEPLAEAIEILMLTGEELARRAPGRWIIRALARRRPRRGLQPPDPARDRADIAYHYDLGNDLYATFLDQSMTYSSAVFTRPGQRLEDAQEEKYRRIAQRLEASADDHVLEIGCGWGGFAIHLARTVGCRVTGLTLSEDQHAFATARVAEYGLDHLVEIRLQDYREVQGSFDRIASIEMFEAIGEAEHARFFATCRRLLGPDGRMCIQVITIRDERWERYRRTRDWIQTYIFPGSTVPSLAAIVDATAGTGLAVVATDDIGAHYATTLREWRRRFDERVADVRALGFSEAFVRAWRFYLAACEAGFAVGALQDHQITILPATRGPDPDASPHSRPAAQRSGRSATRGD